MHLEPFVPQPRRAGRRLFASLAGALLAVAGACAERAPSGPLVTGSDAPSLARNAPAPSANTINLSIAGLPAGTPAGVRVTGAKGFSRIVDQTTSLAGLADGNYAITASNVTAGGATYAPTPASQSFSLRKGKVVNASVTFATVPTTGALALTITIGESTPAAVTVTGPNAFSQSVPATQTLSGLAPGTYTIAAANVTSGTGVTYVPSATSQTASVTAGATVARSVTYTATTVPPGGGLNLQVLGMYLTQSVQTMAGAVPLVRGRDGVLRVFAVASGSNSAQPTVRARLYQGGTLVATLTASAPATAVPTSLNEGSATASWNIKVPGSLIQPGLAILADVDPEQSVAESDEGDNTFPASGTPLAVTVRVVPALAVRFVPVLTNGNGLTGNISDTNAPTYLQGMRDMFPLETVTSSVRATYTTSTGLSSDGTGWSTVLSELSALRRADASAAHYYGVVKVSYSSGVAGIGYIGSPTSMGWDGSAASETMAHEFGHNWGRYHAPCGGPANPDPNFPYTGGIIGVYGFNVRTNALLATSTADLMGYCRPRWVSDYNYNAVMNYRGFSTSSAMAVAADGPGLLVWGRIAADGTITLEPAIRVVAPAALPERSGSYTLEGRDASGTPLFALAFDPDETSDDAGVAERHFAFVVPLGDALAARLEAVRVGGRGRTAERRTVRGGAAATAAASAASLDAAGAGRSRLRWNATDAAMVMVRDARSGEILSLARGGDVALAHAGTELDLTFSDGVRSTARRLRVRGR